jgi:hypothetical protein
MALAHASNAIKMLAPPPPPPPPSPKFRPWLRHCLKAGNSNKATGPDNIPGKVLKIAAEILFPSLTAIYNRSLSMGIYPDDCKIQFNSIQKHLFKHDIKIAAIKLLMWSCVYQYSKIYLHMLC